MQPPLPADGDILPYWEASDAYKQLKNLRSVNRNIGPQRSGPAKLTNRGIGVSFGQAHQGPDTQTVPVAAK